MRSILSIGLLIGKLVSAQSSDSENINNIGGINIWELNNNTIIKPLYTLSKEFAMDAKWSPDGLYIIGTGSANKNNNYRNYLYLWAINMDFSPESAKRKLALVIIFLENPVL